MPTQYQKNPYVKCQYFYRETSLEIKCKDRGDLAGGTGLVGESTVSCFPTKEEKREHMRDFCNGCYKGCEVYHAFEDMEGYYGSTADTAAYTRV